MRQRKYSSTEREKILRKYENRTTGVREFARRYGISTTTISNWRKEMKPHLRTAPHELGFHHLEARIKSLEEQLAILKSCRFFQDTPLRERLDEMRRMSAEHSIHALSAALDVSRGTYYNDVLRSKGEDAWFNRRRKELTPLVRRVFDRSHGVYGAEQIAASLRLDGVKTNVRTVAKIMIECGLESSRNKSAKEYRRARLNRRNELKLREADFTAEKPNALWVCDVTELQYGRDHMKIYLCAIVDVFARKVVGYRFSRYNNTHLTKATFLKAYGERTPGDGLIFHSDRGSPNVSRRFFDCLKRLHVVQSLSRPHVPQDNAVIESFFRNLKTEVYYPRSYGKLDRLIDEVSAYIEEYNSIRPHSFNRGIPPDRAELEYWAKSSAKTAVSADTRGFDSLQATDDVQ